MNRKIQFRVWNKKSNQFISKERGFNIDIINGYLQPREKELHVIQQFTGLKDKNGKEIYEGDIVSFQWNSSEHEIEDAVGEVYFDDGIFCFCRDLEFASNDCNFDLKSVEVIGNIFENPELLK